MGRLKPLVDWDVAAFENGPDLTGELLLAIPTASQADPAALHWRNPVNSTTMRANRPIGPHDSLQPGNGGGFVVEMGF